MRSWYRGPGPPNTGAVVWGVCPSPDPALPKGHVWTTTRTARRCSNCTLRRCTYKASFLRPQGPESHEPGLGAARGGVFLCSAKGLAPVELGREPPTHA